MSNRAHPKDTEAQDVFVINVQFRQSASWQGTIRWSGQNKAGRQSPDQERHFRSTLEMLKMMDKALAANHPEDEDAQETAGCFSE